MSSGIDSSMSAIFLRELGYDVFGITFQFADLDEKNQQMVDAVKELAYQLKIAHETVDLRKEFDQQVVGPFIEAYLKGKTPFPCAVCNPRIKFYYLNEYARKYGCEYIATGHYANITVHNGYRYISKAVDLEKDQSFFLWGLKQDILKKLILPLGGYQKADVRKIAMKNGFHQLSVKKDSLGICFIQGNDYREFLGYKTVNQKKGYFRDNKGNILGMHNGIINYTIGQRRGLGLNLNRIYFVIDIDAENNEVILGDFQELYKNKVIIGNYYFVNKGELKDKEFTIKIRYRLQENLGRIKVINSNLAEIELTKPVSMVAKEQTAVIYDKERVIGGGFIKSSL